MAAHWFSESPLKHWVELGLLQALEGRRRNRVYGKIATTVESDRLFADAFAKYRPQEE
jgi:hypothetical protein